ncbi:MAG: hypothetical protein QOH06_4476 [Acidobacteriota bacterium]|jgi:hypothetical protein|nr:hypothetical protein [Acidobacteriota bacterium]
MKRKIKKIALNRETLRNLDNRVLANAAGGESFLPCYPPTRSEGYSCNDDCPVRPSYYCA